MTALFDMDGTLFAGDSQLRFARWIIKRHRWRQLYLGLIIPCGLLRAVSILNTEQMKRLFLSYAWGMSREALDAECRQFVKDELLPAIYPEVLEKLRRHQAAGDCTVLCSASPDWWVQHFGKELGFDIVIGTPVETGERVSLMPSIAAPGNNKGANKLVRLATRGIEHAEIGYTDSAADIPMLTICDKAVLVNPKPDFAARTTNMQETEILTPKKDKSPLAFLLSCMLGY